MKRLIFIVEGQTEQEFFGKTVRYYFSAKYNFYTIDVFSIETSPGNKGGFTKYTHLKDNILKSLRSHDAMLLLLWIFLDCLILFRITKQCL